MEKRKKCAENILSRLRGSLLAGNREVVPS